MRSGSCSSSPTNASGLTSSPPLRAPPHGARRYHLGTDRQWGSFLWCVASALYGAAEVFAWWVVAVDGGQDDVMGGGGPSLEEINALLQFVAAVLFLWGSWKFYRGNYPAAREQLHRDVQALTAKGAEPLGWCARYFTFSNELWGSWLFALACVPYPAIGVAYLCAADGSEADEFVGWTYVTGGLAMVAGMAFWALTLSPDALAQNGGGGSTVLYDTLCCCGSEKCRAACGSDFLFMLWIVLVLLVPSVPILVLYAALRPTAMNICYAASIAVLTWGVAAFGRGHDDGEGSRMCNPVTCCCAGSDDRL